MEGRSYGVFLSFSVWDMRTDFIQNLYTRLTDAGVHTFRDEEDLPIGEEIGPSQPRVIEQSKILIPVFSQNYASSRWRLNELAQMVECSKRKGQVILPIFYHVEPSEVQDQTGDYGKALLGYEIKKGVNDKTIRKWKAALNEVGGLNGWIMDDKTNGNEGELVREVVTKVLYELKKLHLVVNDFLVGVERSVEEVLGMIGTNTDDVKIVGIHGMGGIGKTTLAQIVYKKLSLNFDYCCFLDEVRETSHSKGIVRLQKQLLSELSESACSYSILSTDEGIRVIQERLSTKKVLIFLDNVDKTNQLIALLGRQSCFGPGSRILITTRNENVLHEFKVKMTYLVDGLDFESSLQLFSKHAFGRDCPPTEKMEKSTKLVRIACGLPLALKDMGSHLRGRREDMWDDFLVKLEKYGNKDITKKLEISYDALDFNQKQIFLDIACLFAEYHKSTAINMWIDCDLFPKEGLEVLRSKSLIKIRQDNKLWMHSLLQDLGQKIAFQKSGGKLGEQSRLWNYKDSFEILLQKKVNPKFDFFDVVRKSADRCIGILNF